MTFSSEADESYGIQLLSRISSDLQVEEGVKLIIPVAIVEPKLRRPSVDTRAVYGHDRDPNNNHYHGDSPIMINDDKSVVIDSSMMLSCLDAGALDVVASPLDKATIMGLTVHAYRIYKTTKKEQASFLAAARSSRKQSWVGMEEEKPYAYMREAMFVHNLIEHIHSTDLDRVRKLLKGICEPENVIEDYQQRSGILCRHGKTRLTWTVILRSILHENHTLLKKLEIGVFVATTFPKTSLYMPDTAFSTMLYR